MPYTAQECRVCPAGEMEIGMEDEARQKWNIKRRMVLLSGSIGITLGVYLIVKYLFPIAAPFVIAYLIALAIEKPVNALAKKIGGRKTLASTIVMIVLTSVLLSAVAYITWLGVTEIKAFIANFDYLFIMVRQKTARVCLDIDGLFGLTDGCSLEFLCRCADGVKNIFNSGQTSAVVGKVMRISFPIVLKVVFVIGAVLVSFISVVYLSGVLDRIRQWRQVSIFREEVCAVTVELKRLINVYFKIQLVIMLLNALVCIIGLSIMKNPYAVVIGILIGIIDALPFFGTGTVLLPWALVLLVFRNFLSAAVILSVYVITYFVREIMESKCMGDRMGIAPFTMLMVIFVGIVLYGIFGFILGPVSYCIMKALIRYLRSVLENAEGTWYT